MKIYELGGGIFVEGYGLFGRPIEVTSFDDFTFQLNVSDFAKRNFNFADVEDIAGTPVGNKTACLAYFSTFFFSSNLWMIDNQFIAESTTETTVNPVFELIPDMTLTTKDLGEPGKYNIGFNGSFQHTTANTNIDVAVYVDSVQVNGSVISAARSSINGDFNISIICAIVNLEVGSVVEVFWRTASGTGTVSSRQLKVIGIGNSKIVT